MNPSKLPLAAAILAAAAALAAAPAPPAEKVRLPARPDDGHGSFATGKYHNYFAEILGKSDADTHAKVQKAFNQLFHGDLHKEALFIPAGKNENGPLAYIPDVQHTDVRSEGMSYGMMIAVQLDKKEEFDALWNWSMSHMYQSDPKHPAYGYFSWEMNYDGTAISELPAPDGEEYYAMALLFAANRWPGGKGIYDYKAQADTLLHNMVHRGSITGTPGATSRKIPVPAVPANPNDLGTIIVSVDDLAATAPAPAAGGRSRGTRGPRETTIGKEVNEQHHMILFSPDERNNYTDPSYHLPAFYELWGRWGPVEDRDFWLTAAQASRDFFVKCANKDTGLIANNAGFEGEPADTGRGPQTPQFREDAWRCAMNWSVDWAWFGKDPREQELSDGLQKFFERKGLANYDDNWSLDGTSLRQRHSPGLVATNGVASMASTDVERRKKFLQALWDMDVPSSEVFRYYDGLLYMMCVTHAAGEFRAIMPKQN